MATYDSLSDAEKDDIKSYDKFLRTLFTRLADVERSSNAEVMNTFSVVNVDPVLETLEMTDVIPNSTNYAGAKDLTVAEFLTLQAIVRGLRTTFSANLAVLVKAIGVNV